VNRFTSFDFGLTSLAAMFHEDWGHLGGVEQVVLARLSPEDESSASESLRKEAAALRQDVIALIDSALSDSQIEVLWCLATGGNYRFLAQESGREFLSRVSDAVRQWEQVYGSAPADSDPDWYTSVVVDRVFEAIAGASYDFSGGEYCGADRSDDEAVRRALDCCARSASPELAFRLLLRIYLANFLPVDPASWVRYGKLAADFSYGEFLLPSLEFLVDS
jgi:hypothetical protein